MDQTEELIRLKGGQLVDITDELIITNNSKSNRSGKNDETEILVFGVDKQNQTGLQSNSGGMQTKSNGSHIMLYHLYEGIDFRDELGMKNSEYTYNMFLKVT